MQQLTIQKTFTNRDENVKRYLSEVRKIPQITPDEEVSLVIKIKQGDQHALDKLIKANLRFVVSVAKQYQNQGLSLSDLINEGNLGLIKAAQRYDESRGFKFISYAVWWIRNSIIEALEQEKSFVRLPDNKVLLRNSINKFIQRFEQEYYRVPTIEEIAQHFKIHSKEVDTVLFSSGRPTSLDIGFGSEEEMTLLGILPNHNTTPTDRGLWLKSLRYEVAQSLAMLKPNHRQVIKMFFGINAADSISLGAIAHIKNQTDENIRQIKERGLLFLRENCSHLSEFLG